MKTVSAPQPRPVVPAFDELVSLGRRTTSRELAFAGLVLLCVVNGVTPRIVLAGEAQGWLNALQGTFGISVLIWAAAWLSLRYLLTAPQTPLRKGDLPIAVAAASLTLVPVASLSWVALAGISLWLIRTSPPRSDLHRGAWIGFALTVPAFWSKEVFGVLSQYILQIEAVLIGTAMGTPFEGNRVQFANGSGYMQILPACSSFANVSLAILSWMMFSQVSGYTNRPRAMMWCGLACVAVLVINVTRISLIGFFPHHYDLLHGPIGETVAGWMTLLATVAICAVGVRDGYGEAMHGGAAHG